MGYHSRSGLDAGTSAQAQTTGSFNKTKGLKNTETLGLVL
jgi:hypothetical protein